MGGCPTDIPPNRLSSARAGRRTTGLRHGAAVAACLVVGLGGGAATAEVWDLGGAASTEAAPPPTPGWIHRSPSATRPRR